MKHKTVICAIAAIAVMTSVSCDSYKDTDTPKDLVEVDKDLSGVWQLTEVKRNDIDISSSMDFTQFRLHLEKNGRYSLENRLPFPVRENGFWEVDNPEFPFQLTFTEDDVEGDPVDVEIRYPIVDGERQLCITHSPGCDINSYEYTFKKSN